MRIFTGSRQKPKITYAYQTQTTDPHKKLTESYSFFRHPLGTVLCLSIVWCNLMVASALRKLGRRNGALRRISRASSRAKPLLNVTGPPQEVGITAEERAFAKLMALLSISFLICWMPQMVSSRITFFEIFGINKWEVIFYLPQICYYGSHTEWTLLKTIVTKTVLCKTHYSFYSFNIS